MGGEIRFCEHLGCTSRDVSDYVHLSTYMSEDGDPDNPTIQWLCDKHAAEFGYCLGCHQFCGGFESYEFSEVPGYCAECVEDFKYETGEYDDDDYDDDMEDY